MARNYIFAIILFSFFFLPCTVRAASLSLSPAAGSFEEGERFPVRILINSNNASFNAVSGVLHFPPSIFSIESVSKSNSVLNFWATEPTVSSASGTVTFEGIALGGSPSTTGTVLTVNLLASNIGTGKVAFRSGQVLANDGEGTDITGNLNGGTFSVIAATPLPNESPVEVPPKKNTPTPKEPDSKPEFIQPAPTLNAPEIMLGESYGAPAILGTSDYPNSQVLVTFASKDGAKIFIVGIADDGGNFSVLVPRSLKRGAYEVSAVMIKEDKTNSESSNKIVVDVGNIFSDTPKEVYVFMFLLVLTVLYLLLRVFWHFGVKNWKTRVRGINKAETIVHKSFDILREDVSSSEPESISQIKKDINEAEKIITKQIKDIEP